MSNNLCSLKTPQVDFSSLANLRILIVDDNIDCLYLVQVIFEDYQAQVKTCRSVDEAIEAIEESKPDVLISDICMQGKDGYSLIRSIRLKEALEGGFLPALALTGYAHPQARTKALEAGFQELILKPFDADKLVAEVAKLTRLCYSSTNKQTFSPGEGKRGKEKRGKEKIILNTHKSFSYMTPNKGLKPPRSCVAFNWGGVTIPESNFLTLSPFPFLVNQFRVSDGNL